MATRSAAMAQQQGFPELTPEISNAEKFFSFFQHAVTGIELSRMHPKIIR
jgi:hypothetical protein